MTPYEEDELDKALRRQGLNNDEVGKALLEFMHAEGDLARPGPALTQAGTVADLPHDAIKCIIDRLGDDVVRAQVHAKGAGRRAFQALISRADNKAKMDKEKEEADEAVERAERGYDRSVSRLMATCKQLHVVVYPTARKMYDEWCSLQHAKSMNDWALQTMHN